MRYLKRRHIEPATYIDQLTARQRSIDEHRVKRCGVCTMDFPESDVTVEDGVDKCPWCVDTYTNEYLTNEQRNVSDVILESTRRLYLPPQRSTMPLTEPRAPIVLELLDDQGQPISTQNPIRLSNRGEAVVTLNGRYFTDAITFTYPAGVVDSYVMQQGTIVIPDITSTQIILSLAGELEIVPGLGNLTMNDGVSTYGHTWNDVFLLT